MTLAKRKTRLVFEVSGAARGRALIIEAKPYVAVLREKGRRMRYEITWESIYWLAAKAAAEEARAARKQKRGLK
jgi:hypothetical protein